MRQSARSASATSRRWHLPLLAALLSISTFPAAVAVDWHFSARMLQQHADSYALALAREVARGRLPPRVYPPPGINIAFVSPPTEGAYAGRADAVHVEAQRLWTPPLPSLFGGTREMRARSTAARSQNPGTNEQLVIRVE